MARSRRKAFCRFIQLGVNPRSVVLVVLCLSLLIPLVNGVLGQVDITEKVRRGTALDAKIQDFCSNYCQGNRRECRLTSVTVQPIGNGRYRGTMIAELRNWQETGDPFNVTIFDWTVRVRTEGLLQADTCTVVIDSVTVDNDIQDFLSGILEEQKGQKYQIPNCKRLLP